MTRIHLQAGLRILFPILDYDDYNYIDTVYTEKYNEFRNLSEKQLEKIGDEAFERLAELLSILSKQKEVDKSLKQQVINNKVKLYIVKQLLNENKSTEIT